jgi:phosphatidylglycerol:prolipoprotein diacylglycerol transferase
MFIYPKIDPIAFQLGPLKVHWYGLMYLFGIGGAWLLALYRSRQSATHWDAEAISDLILYVALGIIIGGRVGYLLFYGWANLIDDPLSAIKIWQGGMSFHGGLLGVICAVWLFAKRRARTVREIGDFVAPLVPIGFAAGRGGNFINGELWGRVTDVPWAMVFPHVDQLPRHANQLYELFFEGFILFIILWWYSSKPRQSGQVSGMFLICYACFRIFIEFFRQPDPQLGFIAFDWLTMGQLLSIPMLIVGVIFLVNRKKAN